MANAVTDLLCSLRLLRGSSLIDETLWVTEGKIMNPDRVAVNSVEAHSIDLKGAIVSPGFIDVQVNGGYGIDFTHDLIKNPDGIKTVSKEMLATGVTAFCPTLISTTPEVYHQVLPLLARKAGGAHGATILGAHVEGPFLNNQWRGGHGEDLISDLHEGPTSVLKMYKHLSAISVVTLAPEKDKGLEVIRWLDQHNIVVGLGHTQAGLITAQSAVESGARLITHLFNAMRPFHHREPAVVGLLGSKYATQVFYSIIADGTHLHRSALKFAFSAHPEGVILITDCIAATGAKEGSYQLGEKRVELKGKNAYLADTKTIAGSTSKINECIKFFKRSTGCSTEDALKAATLNPAKMLEINGSKGTLDFDKDADFVVLSDELEVLSTWIAGQNVYTKPS